uniref:Uncharacterized protein LOC104231312 n=1 Tax=Nicotiana sylvestris TaxID=4096 RepID=A0A1U7X7Z2_NICSY|nr:PREDICTED: uncharacterized protein LOC104231312 [Nicotiana sylvestris]
MEDEMKSLHESGIYELVKLPKGKRALSNKWIFRIKQDNHTYAPRYKARKPVHQAHDRYVPYAGRHEALAIGLHTVYPMGQQMQSHVHDPVAMQEYSRRFMDMAA